MATIKIRDRCKDKGGPGTFVWEIYIVIQQDSTGAIGIIDPDIENQD